MKYSQELRKCIQEASLISISLDALYDQKNRKLEKKKLIGGILLTVDETIVYQEKRFKTLLLNLNELLNHGT